MKPLFVLSLLVSSAFAQYPGQYPPGQYPPGQYPPGQGTGLPIPGRKKTTTQETKTDQTFVIRGVVRSYDGKILDIEAEDERSISLHIVETTKKPSAALVPGDKVEVDATRDEKGIFNATTIRKTGSGPAPAAMTQPDSTSNEQPENNTPATTRATPVPLDADDEGGPPTLKRGVPKTRKASPPTQVARNETTTTPSEAPTPASTASTETPKSPPVGRLDLIDKARTVSEEFLTGLPNYVCQQFTTRYAGEGHPTNWQPLDVVSAEVIYEKGQERYEHLAINGNAVKKSIEETGAWSTGEFGTVLADLFSPATAAAFKYAGSRTIARRSAALYDFEVDHSHSHWRIKVPGQYVTPAYRGSVWISKDTGRVLRIEMQAVKIPVEFPRDTTEMAIDYDDISLGTPEKYLLPVKSENLSCERGSSRCDRNVIEFRNYHKYAGESTITFK